MAASKQLADKGRRMVSTMTPDGKAWFTLATDPFHDAEVRVVGLPDQYHDATVTSYKKIMSSIKRPENLPPGAKWTAHFFTLPILKETRGQISFFDPVGDITIDPVGSSSVLLGTINVWTALDGVPLFPTTQSSGEWALEDPLGTREYWAFGSLCDDSLLMARLIGGGFEVFNDTAELFKSGSVTVYSAPQESSETFVGIIDDTVDVGAGAMKNFRGVPATLEDAAQYRTARTWEAKDGALVPFQMNFDTDVNRFQPQAAIIRFFRSGDDEFAGGVLQQTAYNAVLFGPADHIRSAPLDTVGAFFSGLTPETVLTMNAKAFVELAPTVRNPQELTLASKPSTYDPVALKCYQHCMALLPPGVKVDNNAHGDWWRSVLSALGTMTTPAATAIGMVNPIAGDIAKMTLPAVNNLIEKAITKSEARSKTRAKGPVATNPNVRSRK